MTSPPVRTAVVIELLSHSLFSFFLSFVWRRSEAALGSVIAIAYTFLFSFSPLFRCF